MPPVRSNRRSKSPTSSTQAHSQSQPSRPSSSQSTSSSKSRSTKPGQPYPTNKHTTVATAPSATAGQIDSHGEQLLTSPDRKILALLQPESQANPAARISQPVRIPQNIAPAPHPRHSHQPTAAYSLSAPTPLQPQSLSLQQPPLQVQSLQAQAQAQIQSPELQSPYSMEHPPNYQPHINQQAAQLAQTLHHTVAPSTMQTPTQLHPQAQLHQHRHQLSQHQLHPAHAQQHPHSQQAMPISAAAPNTVSQPHPHRPQQQQQQQHHHHHYQPQHSHPPPLLPHPPSGHHHSQSQDFLYAIPQPIQQIRPSFQDQSYSHPDLNQPRSRHSTGAVGGDSELRDLLDRNLHRTLDEVAKEVTANERTSSAEKYKQLFAMLWLRDNLVPTKNSVPRIRVHTQYANRCSAMHLHYLNHASFGKLVRVLFPNIQTRRLGMRGESKYHYVDLSLVRDIAEGTNDHTTNRSRAGTTTEFTPSIRPLESTSRIGPDSAVIPSDNPSAAYGLVSSKSDHHPISPRLGATSQDSEVRIFPAPLNVSISSRATTYKQKLKFSKVSLMCASGTEDIKLPIIYDFAPAKWDPDLKDALQAAYNSHVINLIDSIRYCNGQTFFGVITAFQGTITEPVGKLFCHESVAPWIRACDFLMYQRIIRFLTPLTLQVIPPKVVKFLSSLRTVLYDHIERTFSSSQKHVVPVHTLNAKLEPAAVFCHLLERLIRANQTAHAACATLIEDEDRQRMWSELVRNTNPKTTMSAFIPDCAYDEDVYKLLTFDIRKMLLPLITDPTLENGTHYQAAAAYHNMHPQPASFELDRIGDFVESLKTRFPIVSSKDLLLLIQAVTSSILRDIVMASGQSYNCWLMVMCFIDELALWLAHAGGFLDYDPVAVSLAPETSQPGDASTDRVTAFSNPNGIKVSVEGSNGVQNSSGAGGSYQVDDAHNHKTAAPTTNGHFSTNVRSDPQSKDAIVSAQRERYSPNAGSTAIDHQQANLMADASQAIVEHSKCTSIEDLAPSASHVQLSQSTTPDLDMDDSGIGLSLADENVQSPTKSISDNRSGVFQPIGATSRLGQKNVQPPIVAEINAC